MASARSDAFSKAARATLGDTPTKPLAKQRRQARAGRPVWAFGLAGGLVLAVAGAAVAGPPYVTDDPAPTDRGHWEIYGFAAGAHASGDTAGAAGLDLNYGAARNLQLTVVVPAAVDHDAGETHVGIGVLELAAKYQLLHQRPGSWLPSVSVFPRLFAPTAKARFASKRANLLLPIWLGEDFGPWSVFGGGGYQLNPGPGARDFWTGGLALTCAIDPRTSIGGEVYHHTRDAADARPFTGLNLGVTYRLNGHWSLLAAGGPGLQNAGGEGRYDGYVALKADY